jgi:hypothetical protein
MTKFAPTVLVDGYTYTPPGWMWLLAFAREGVEWAKRDLEEMERTGELARQIKWYFHLQQFPDYEI